MADKFFTGVPCKNGHISERYRSTRHCVECLRKSHRRPSLDGFIVKKLRIPTACREALVTYAWALASLRADNVTGDDVVLGTPPTHLGGGTGVYRVKIHPDDADALATFGADLIDAMGKLDVAAARQRAQRVVGARYLTPEPPPMLFK